MIISYNLLQLIRGRGNIKRLTKVKKPKPIITEFFLPRVLNLFAIKGEKSI